MDRDGQDEPTRQEEADQNGPEAEPQHDSDARPQNARQLIRKVKRHARRRVGAEDKIRIVMEGLRGELTVADLCRREGVNKMTYYGWLKSFLEAGKRRLAGDHLREANSDEVHGLQDENESLKKLVAELLLENRRLKKSHLE
jgi:transposase